MKAGIKLGLLMAIALCVGGCTTTGLTQKKETPTPTVEKKESVAVYYDFKDVLVPEELKIDEDATVIISTPGLTSGVLALRGRVEKNSLFNFFHMNMIKDNWNIVSQIKSPKITMLVFQKANRWAVVNIRENELFTYVEIGVAPTQEQVLPMESGEISLTN
ncbi:hypothetical protein SAMN02746065_102278 [Desulfocicer vacuolatum DSM 3385]|uniref:Lipoprotein n=1 Tax=Desulfocicer vacuolatum DSM 3385 TaxID=1121400 RepID=A0A1W1ZG38_9BACT|nr:hypothetical protein [Desulfocicer vacuolatum]SMC47460.1 hypothetical protein SAMN02746065_102278 [Desulfocicer vacuolatum DSM 3385]